MTRNALSKRLKRRGIITSIRGLSTEDLIKLEGQSVKIKGQKKELSMTRNAIVKRLKRRGLVSNPKGLSTDFLKEMWEKYKDFDPVKKDKIDPLATNYEILLGILDNLVGDYKEYFIGWYTDAWIYLPELEHLWRRVDKEKINNDEEFVPHEVRITFHPPSNWEIDNVWRMSPEDIADHVIGIYDKYFS